MTRAGGISRIELDQALREVAGLVGQARERGWDSDPIGEHHAQRTARAHLARISDQLGDRAEHLEHEHGHQPGFAPIND